MYNYFMTSAFKLAEQALKCNTPEVPVGAVIVHQQQIIASAHNQTLALADPCAHAEILALRAAGHYLQSPHLSECDLYVTLEPCPMCAYAISLARIRVLYFGAYDIKGGGVDHGPRIFNSSSCHHRPQVFGGLMADQSTELLQRFFVTKR